MAENKVKKSAALQFCAAAVPFALTAVAFVKRMPLLLVGTSASLFILTAVLPVCRKRENLWMFLFVAVFAAPVNLWLSLQAFSYLISDNGTVYALLCSALVFCVSFSAEEIAFGALTRLIWRRQYKLFPKDFDE